MPRGRSVRRSGLVRASSGRFRLATGEPGYIRPMTQRAYRGRRPRAPMDAASVVEVVDTLERADVDVWLDGGWGVDALLEHETREHDDLDLVCELRHAERVIELLAGLGYKRVAGELPKSFASVDSLGRQVDVHPVSFDAEGGGHYQMDDGRIWVYPAQGFGGQGLI